MSWYHVELKFGPGHQSREECWWEFPEDYTEEDVKSEIEDRVNEKLYYTSQLEAKWEKKIPPVEILESKIKGIKSRIDESITRLEELEKQKESMKLKEER